MSTPQREAGTSARVLLNEVRSDLEREDRIAIGRARLWILFRLCVILGVLIYMHWISEPLARMTPDELTRVASVRLEQRLPEARGRLRDYALSEASAAARHAHSLLIEVPTQLRSGVESKLLTSTDALIQDFEIEIASWLTDSMLERASSAGDDPRSPVQLPPPTAERVERWYERSSDGTQALDAYFSHLQRDEGLSDAELLDRRLIEAWMALVGRRAGAPDELRMEQASRGS